MEMLTTQGNEERLGGKSAIAKKEEVAHGDSSSLSSSWFHSNCDFRMQNRAPMSKRAYIKIYIYIAKELHIPIQNTKACMMRPTSYLPLLIIQKITYT